MDLGVHNSITNEENRKEEVKGPAVVSQADNRTTPIGMLWAFLYSDVSPALIDHASEKKISNEPMHLQRIKSQGAPQWVLSKGTTLLHSLDCTCIQCGKDPKMAMAMLLTISRDGIGSARLMLV